jgi:hypothetical protein
VGADLPTQAHLQSLYAAPRETLRRSAFCRPGRLSSAWVDE